MWTLSHPDLNVPIRVTFPGNSKTKMHFFFQSTGCEHKRMLLQQSGGELFLGETDPTQSRVERMRR